MAGKYRKFSGRALALLGALCVSSGVYAASIPLPVLANFVSSTIVALTSTEMDFGAVSFGGVPTGADTVTVTTAGARSFGGANFASGGGAPVAAGDVAIVATGGSTLDVSCATSGTLAQASGAGRIDFNSIRVANESAAAGGGVSCTGLGNVVLSFTTTVPADDQLKIGGTIDGATQVSFGAGSYSTSNAGGSSVQVDVVYQ